MHSSRAFPGLSLDRVSEPGYQIILSHFSPQPSDWSDARRRFVRLLMRQLHIMESQSLPLSIATSIVGYPRCHGVYSVAIDIVIADAIVIAADIGIVGDIESLLSPGVLAVALIGI
jgi:hypothetical protein